MTALHDMSTWWHPAYIDAARNAYPAETKGHELAVGWKLTSVTGRTHGGYFWPLIDGDHDLPLLHECDDWQPANKGSCPSREGDGFCLVTDDGIASASSGGQRLASATGRVLVYPADLAVGDEVGKWRVPWVVDVDCFDPLASIRGGYVADLSGADLSRAYLSGVDLSGANLYGANLSRANLNGANLNGVDLSRANLTGVYLSGVDLSGADLSGADLYGADLSGAYLSGADLYGADLSGAVANSATVWPVGFAPHAAGVQQ